MYNKAHLCLLCFYPFKLELFFNHSNDKFSYFFLLQIAGIDHAIFIQRNSLNKLDRTLKIEAWNESFSNRLVIKEHCYYSVSYLRFIFFKTFFTLS